MTPQTNPVLYILCVAICSFFFWNDFDNFFIAEGDQLGFF